LLTGVAGPAAGLDSFTSFAVFAAGAAARVLAPQPTPNAQAVNVSVNQPILGFVITISRNAMTDLACVA
jgi:hypothetical protein